MSFYCLMKHWILHIACIPPASWLKIFVFSKISWLFRNSWFCLGTAGGLAAAPRSSASAISFKLNVVSKTVAAFFSEMNLENNCCGCFCFYKKAKFSQKHLWQNPFLQMMVKVCSQQFYLKRLHHRCFAVNFAKLSRTSLPDTPLNGCLRFQTSLENGTCML